MAGWTIGNRAYIGEHTDAFLSPSKKGYACYERTVVRPVFLSFVDADFSCFEGFLKLIDVTGLTGCAYLDEDSKYKYPIGDELKKNSISNSFIEGFYNRHKKTLQDDQASIKLFYEWFVEGKQPLINNLHPDFKDDMPFPSVFLSQKDLQYKPRNKEEEKLYIDAYKLFTDLKIHLSGVTLEPIFNSAPIIDKAYETVMETGCKEILSGDKHKHSKCVESLSLSNLWKASRKVVFVARQCSSLPALCYLEMIDLIEDEHEFRKCSHCGELFIPVHEREIFCNRIAPEFKPQGRLTTAEEWKSIFKKTCKKIGPQKKHNNGLSPEDREIIKKDKRFRSRLDYLKKTGNDGEYKKVLRNFNKWRNGGSNHGKKKLKG